MASEPQWPPYFYEYIPTDRLPVGHRPVTILSLFVTFQLLSWTAVIFRLYCAGAAARGYGWDDLFVVLSAICSLTTTILTGLGTSHGVASKADKC